jgi:endoglucanase
VPRIPSQVKGQTLATLLAAVFVAACSSSSGTGAVPPRVASLPERAERTNLTGIRVSGNQLVDGHGSAVHLRGVNRSGTEYACVQGWGIFDGPNDGASIDAIASWHVNIVRVLLNEDCWLDINGMNPKYAGKNYIDAIVAYVNLLHQHGMYAEVSLIWGAPGKYKATYQPDAPDEDHAPAMWSSMAATFKNDPNVILAPWGETTVGWKCFMRKGCDDEATYGPQNKFYLTASMKQAVNLMRKAGYRGIVSIPCIDYANACGKINGSDYNGSTWLKSRPSDPENQTIAEAHVYGKNLCDAVKCFDSSMRPITKVVPLIFGETGETYDASDCGSSYISAFMTWADAHGVGYEAWTWDTWGGCGVLIKDYGGTPSSAWARWVKQHYLKHS